MRVRSWLVLAGLVLTAAACSGVETEGPAASFPLPQAERAELMARALEQVCEESCAGRRVYLYDRIADLRPIVVAEPIPFEIRSVIRETITGVQMVGLEELETLLGDDGRVDGGEGVVLSLGPVSTRGPDLVAVNVGVTSDHNEFVGYTILFRWDGREWRLADTEAS